jgi:hypothetical protein
VSKIGRDMLFSKTPAFFGFYVSTGKASDYSDIPTIAAHTIGSVGVKQAAMTSEERKLRFGNNPTMMASNNHSERKIKIKVDCIPAVITHPKAIVGTTITNSPLA